MPLASEPKNRWAMERPTGEGCTEWFTDCRIGVAVYTGPGEPADKLTKPQWLQNAPVEEPALLDQSCEHAICYLLCEGAILTQNGALLRRRCEKVTHIVQVFHVTGFLGTRRHQLHHAFALGPQLRRGHGVHDQG